MLPDALRERAARVKLLALDVDGVLTDGRLYYGPDGESLKVFDVKDGLGLRLLREESIAIAIVSAKRSTMLERRLADLKIPDVCLGREDKRRALDEVCARVGASLDEVCFVGDDAFDLPVLRAVGLSAAPADAHPIVKREVAWLLQARGGRGAVREVCDALLDARGRLDAAIEALLSPR
ncbi:MAG: HAD-IIIA family hydrolase [Myxococcota bacterium]|jgi:3-deoxy-D-manno-octulosonate 8-phosphate phosphatase (KDO 8-P phosphatase)|nr:HAD-IIIA family hydrolase [Myxococcota bacterium]